MTSDVDKYPINEFIDPCVNYNKFKRPVQNPAKFKNMYMKNFEQIC